MTSILLILLIIFFVAVILLLSLGTYILSVLLGGFMNLKNFVCRIMGWNNGKRAQSSANNTTSHTSSSHTASQSQASSSKGKMFDQDEGTYIDFEEVK